MLEIKVKVESFFRRVVKHCTRMKWVIVGRLKYRLPVYTKNEIVKQRGLSLSESDYKRLH